MIKYISSLLHPGSFFVSATGPLFSSNCMLGYRKIEILYKLCKHLGSTLTCYSPQWWWHVCMFRFHIMPSSVENTFSLIFRTQFLPQPQHIWRCSITVPTSFPSVSIWMAPLLLTTSFHAGQAILLICIAHSIIQLLPSLPLLSHPPKPITSYHQGESHSSISYLSTQVPL